MTRRSSNPPPDVLAALADDPRYREHLRQQEEARLAAAAEFFADTSVLHADLRALGLPANALATYFDRLPMPGRAMGVLVAHLPRPYAPSVWESIVRSLTRPDARPALPMLRTAYQFERQPARRWLLANAMSAMVPFAEVRDLPEMAQYEPLFRHGFTPPHLRRPG